MITRWQEVSKQVADSLGLDPDKVKKRIQQLAKVTEEHLNDPTVMETDVFGIGTFCARYGRIKRSIAFKKARLRIKLKYRDLAKIRGESLKMEIINKSIFKLQSQIDVLEEFLRLKGVIYDSGGREVWSKNRRTEKNNKPTKRAKKKKCTDE